MKNPNAKMLAMRDPALAALMGVSVGADFGADFAFQGDFSGDFGGADMGFEFGDDSPSAAMAPPQQVAAQLWAKHSRTQARTAQRAALLEPNSGSTVKVERYAFYLNQTLALGAAVAINATNQPDTNIRPQRVTMNAPAPGFATIDNIKVANVSVIVGGSADAYEFNANGVGQTMDMPTLSPANRATVTGNYSGFVPPGYVSGSEYLFSIGLKGPASIVA